MLRDAFGRLLPVQEVVSQDANIFTKLWSRAQPKRKTHLYRYMTDQAIKTCLQVSKTCLLYTSPSPRD